MAVATVNGIEEHWARSSASSKVRPTAKILHWSVASSLSQLACAWQAMGGCLGKYESGRELGGSFAAGKSLKSAALPAWVAANGGRWEGRGLCLDDQPLEDRIGDWFRTDSIDQVELAEQDRTLVLSDFKACRVPEVESCICQVVDWDLVWLFDDR